jgi:hypothetical protein
MFGPGLEIGALSIRRMIERNSFPAESRVSNAQKNIHFSPWAEAVGKKLRKANANTHLDFS